MKLELKPHRLYQKALQYYSWGNCKNHLYDYRGAIADFTKAIKYNPNFAEAYYRRANIKIILKDTEGAILDYDRAIKLNPDFAQAVNNKEHLKPAAENVSEKQSVSLEQED